MVDAWANQIAEMTEMDEASLSDDFPTVGYARQIVEERTSENYAIYVLMQDEEPLAFTHLNVALLPRTSGSTLRSVWTTFAPKFELQDQETEELVDLITKQLVALVDVATNGDMRADHMKMQLANLVDRRFYVMLTRTSYKVLGDAISVRGNWLHMDDLDLLT